MVIHRQRGRERTPSAPSDSPLLPGDALGRAACLLIGGFFGTLGTWSLVIANRRGLGDFVMYELSGAAVFFGACLVLWGLFTPPWLVRVAHHAVARLLWIVLILFLPIALHALILMFSGKI